MENFVLSTIINTAKENGFNTIKGEYIFTNKNDLVKDHYTDLGFRKEQNRFYLDIKDYQEKLNYIKIKL